MNAFQTTKTKTKAGNVAKGEFVRFKDTETAPVWVRGDYDRASKRYAFYQFDDVNHERFVKRDRECFIGFTF